MRRCAGAVRVVRIPATIRRNRGRKAYRACCAGSCWSSTEGAEGVDADGSRHAAGDVDSREVGMRLEL